MSDVSAVAFRGRHGLFGRRVVTSLGAPVGRDTRDRPSLCGATLDIAASWPATTGGHRGGDAQIRPNWCVPVAPRASRADSEAEALYPCARSDVPIVVCDASSRWRACSPASWPHPAPTRETSLPLSTRDHRGTIAGDRPADVSSPSSWCCPLDRRGRRVTV